MTQNWKCIHKDPIYLAGDGEVRKKRKTKDINNEFVSVFLRINRKATRDSRWA